MNVVLSRSAQHLAFRISSEMLVSFLNKELMYLFEVLYRQINL